jgi:DNA-binding IclR family transcriptional regulator
MDSTKFFHFREVFVYDVGVCTTVLRNTMVNYLTAGCRRQAKQKLEGKIMSSDDSISSLPPVSQAVPPDEETPMAGGEMSEREDADHLDDGEAQGDAVIPAVRKPRDPTVHAARHAIEILRCISQAQPEIGISEIARRVGMHKSSVSRLISTLEAQRVVERNHVTDRICLGVGLMAIVAPLMSRAGVSQASRARMSKLADRSGETVNLSVWDGRVSVSVDQTLGPNAITHFAAPGKANPPHCTASGKILLAFASEADISAILASELTEYTDRTETDPEVLRRQLAHIRATGVAVNRGEFSAEAGAVAALVRDLHGLPSAALTITVPIYRFSPARERELLDLVQEAARDISGQLKPVKL